MVIDREVAKNEEYWRRLPGDRFGECWHRNNYFFNGFTTKNHTSVVFRKVDYRGDEVKFYYPDIILNGKIKERTARKIMEATQYILKEDHYPIY